MRLALVLLLAAPPLALAQRADGGAPFGPPRQPAVAKPFTLFVEPGRADLHLVTGAPPGPGLQQTVKLWSDHVVRVLLHNGFTVTDDPQKPADAQLKLAITVEPQQHLANITLTVEQNGQIIDVIEQPRQERWNSAIAVQALVDQLDHSGRLQHYAAKHHAPSPVEQAKAHHEAATKHFDLGQFDDAIKEWMAAYELDARPAFLYNIANAYRRKGEIESDAADLKRALHFYRRYSENDPKAASDAQEPQKAVEALLKKLEKKK